MSELHFDNDGEPAQQHPQCVEVRWRRFRNPGMRGAPEVVHEKDGSQLYTTADITYLEFSTRVNGVPGRYRGDQVDASRRLVPGATPFYVTITEAPRNATAGSATDDLLRHVISANVRQTEVIAERFAGMMEQAAEMLRQTSEVLRVFTGANLLQRQAPPEPDDDDDDQEEDDDEDQEPGNAAAAVLKEIKPITDQAFGLFETWLLQRAAKPAASPPSSPPATPPPPSAPPPATPPPPSAPPPPAAPPPPPPNSPPPAPAAPGPVPTTEPRNAAAVMPTPEQAQHLLAIQAALNPTERTIARAVINRMTAEQRVDWLRELSALTVEQAVALVRSMIPAPDAERRPAVTIAVPLPTNLTPGEMDDSVCLGAATELLARMVRERDPELIALAQKHGDTASLVEDLRSRPQRDDEGIPDDGPKVDACDPPQRLQVNSPFVNCFERTVTYIGAAEHIDPLPVRRMATAMTPNGLHTFPIEDGEPIVLDPYQSRNALAASLYRAARARRNGGEQAMTPWQAVDWIAEIAAEPAARFTKGPQRVRNAHRAVTSLLGGRALCVADVRDVAFMLALADRESRMWGPTGPRIVATTAHALDKVDQAAARQWKSTCGPRNAAELRIGDYRIRPDTALLGSLGRIGGRLGYRAGIEALRVKLASLGVTPPVLNTIERELNREGLSLGALSKPPPMPGSLNALTPEAVAGHWLAGKL